MKMIDLDMAAIREAGAASFPQAYIETDTTDFYLPDIETGEVMIEGIDHPVYVSTHYAYEDRLVNGNKTRYKMHLPIIYVKKDPYEVIYDSHKACYVAYEQEGQIRFSLYEDFYPLIKDHITLVKKK